MVLGGEDVAAGPGDLSTEGGQCLDKDGSLDSYLIINNEARVYFSD